MRYLFLALAWGCSEDPTPDSVWVEDEFVVDHSVLYDIVYPLSDWPLVDTIEFEVLTSSSPPVYFDEGDWAYHQATNAVELLVYRPQGGSTVVIGYFTQPEE